MPDLINHPPHYNEHPSGVECITITEHMNFSVGNAVKFMWRAGLKDTDALPDLEKARWYVDREIQRRGGAPLAAPKRADEDRCVAHGEAACQICHLSKPGGLNDDGDCPECGTYGSTGMHWDTCPNRARGIVWSTDPVLETVGADELVRRLDAAFGAAALGPSDEAPRKIARALLAIYRITHRSN